MGGQMGKLKTYFRKVRDPRAANASYPLLEILFVALAAVLSGAKTCTDMSDFGRRKIDLLRRFVPLERGVPSHDVFSDVFRLLDPAAFARAFRDFVSAFAKFHRLDLSGVFAVDGKSLRGAYERGKSALPVHLVNVFAAKARLALASRKAPGRNEAEAALEILQMLRLKRKIVTADALFCSRPFAKTVLARGGNYVLALKRNQGKLFADVERRFARNGARDTAEQLEEATHDRREKRRASIMRDTTLAKLHNFPGIAAIAKITSWRRRKGEPADKPFVRYFILSTYVSARRLIAIVRSHWGIENQVHWILDVVLAEDANRARKDAAPENLAVLRRLALNLLRTHPEPISMRRKINAAAWDDTFLLSLLGQKR
jgi:predicted transposase YbfD/YdcC